MNYARKIIPAARLLSYMLLIFICLTPLIMTNVAFADKPLWELGGGLAYISVHSYPGSLHKKNYVLPAPSLEYNGNRLKVNRDKIYTPVFKNERIDIKISADGTPPIDSDDITIRQGMPDLEATIQVGPSIEILMNKDPRQPRGKWKFKIPLRVSIATDLSHMDDRGFILNPKLNYRRSLSPASGPLSRGPLAYGPLEYSFTIASMFANRRYLDYYYGVDQAFVNSERTSYQPPSGYAGSYLSMSISKQNGPWFWSAYTRVKWLNGTSFESSPLMETKQEKQLGLLFIYTLAQSLQRVSN